MKQGQLKAHTWPHLRTLPGHTPRSAEPSCTYTPENMPPHRPELACRWATLPLRGPPQILRRKPQRGKPGLSTDRSDG